MEAINDATNFNEQISNNIKEKEKEKSTHENGSSTLKQKSVFTITGVIF